MSAVGQPPLDQAIAAARGGQHRAAYDILRQLVADDPSNAEAWLWLSGVVATPADQQAALERVIALDPQNVRAQRGLQWLREHHPELFASPTTATTSTASVPTEVVVPPATAAPASVAVSQPGTTQPIESVPPTRVPAARTYETQPTEAVESGGLATDQTPETAQQADFVGAEGQGDRGARETGDATSVPSAPTPASGYPPTPVPSLALQPAATTDTHESQPVEVAASVPAVADDTPPTSQQVEAVVPELAATADTFDTTQQMGSVPLAEDGLEEPEAPGEEELRCPYCGEWAGAADARCPRCQGPLIVPAERKAGARFSRVFLALLWLLVSAAAIIGGAWALGEAWRLQAGTSRLGALVQAWDAPVRADALPEIVNGTWPALGALGLIGLIVTVGLWRRWRSIYVLELLLVVVVLGGAVALLITTLPVLGPLIDRGEAVGMIGAVVVGGLLGLALLQLVLTLASRREFFPRHVRAWLPMQSLSGAEHFRVGARYRERGWRWAAARELERAVDQDPQALKYRRALADVYASMGDVRARDQLRASLNLHPDTSPTARAGSIAEELERERQ